jgi:hypothetical protein
MIPAGWSTPHYPSVIKQKVSEQVNWKKWFPSMALKITTPNTTELLPLGLCDEYHLSIRENLQIFKIL